MEIYIDSLSILVLVVSAMIIGVVICGYMVYKQVLVSLKSVEINTNQQIAIATASVQQMNSTVTAVVASVDNKINAFSARASSVAAKATLVYDGWVITQCVLVSAVLVRNIYSRWIKKKSAEERKEANMSEKDVFTAFDTLALVCIVPLFVRDGATGAFAVWRMIKTLGSMVRDACSGIHLFTRLFGKSDDDVPPFMGVGYVDTVAEATDELVSRVEEQKHAKGSCTSCDNIMGDSLCHDCEQKSGGLDMSEMKEQIGEVNTNILFPYWCNVCKVNGSISDHIPCHTKTPNSKPTVDIAHNSLRKIFDQQEDSIYLNKMKTLAESKPWVLPVIIFITFGSLLLVVRWFRTNETEKKTKEKGSIKKKTRGDKRGSSSRRDSPLEDVVTNERASSNASKQAKAARGGKKKKKHYDASGTDSDAEEQGLFFTDEQGNLCRRLGRRAKAHGTQFAINTGWGDYTMQHKKFLEKLPLNKSFVKCEQSEVGDHNVVSLPEGLYFTEKKYENPHKKQLKIVSKKKKEIAKSTPLIKSEAEINGSRFFTSDVFKSVGYARVKSGSIITSMNATMTLNGAVVCEHIFKDGGDKVEITFGDKTTEMPRNKGKLIGRDLLWFPVGNMSTPCLGVARPEAGSKVKLIAYGVHKDAVERKNYYQDDGRIKSVVKKVGEEIAYATYSSIEGSCAAPVVNTDGKVVGFHTGTTSVETVFTPITDEVVRLASGSARNF